MKTQEIQSYLNYIADYCNSSLKFKIKEKGDRNIRILLKNLSKKIKSDQ